MKIRLHSTQDVRDVAPDVAEMMSSAGLADILTPKEANDYIIRSGVPFHSLNWYAREGEIVDGYQYAPALVFRCQTCALLTFAHPMEKPAANTTFHFEKHVCPDDVYQAYLKLFDAWSRKGKRQLKGPYARAMDGYRQRSNDSLDHSELSSIKAGRAVTI